MSDLSITIGADSSDLDREIRDVERQLQTLERRREARVRIGADVGDLDRRITAVNGNLGRLRTNLNQTSQSAQNFNRQTANGSNTLTQFSRIAQDAPFGIMGIGNNLTATAEAFANLSRSAGGARGALQAVGQSLLGGGGILLAISLVTTGLTLMSQKGITVGDIFDKLGGKFDANAKKIEEFTSKATQSAYEEIASVKALVSVAQDETLSRKKRLSAAMELQDEYPNIFGNISKETLLTKDLTKEVNGLTSALVAKATAEAVASEIGKLYAERIKLVKEYREAVKSTNQTILGGTNVASTVTQLISKGWSNATDSIGDASNALKNNKEEILGLQALLNKLTKSYQGVFDPEVKTKKPKKIGSTPQVTGVESNLDTSGLIDLSGKITQIAKNVQGAEGVIATSMGNIQVAFDTGTIDMLETLYKFNDEASRIINESIGNTFASLGQIIGEGMASGSNILQSLGKTLLSSFGSILVELGKLLIKTGVGILAAKVALKSMNPYLAIAGGVALVAVGSAFSSQASSIGDSIGGSGGGSMSSGASYSSPASSGSYATNSGMSGGTVVFEISGTSLIGVLNNTLDRNKRLGS